MPSGFSIERLRNAQGQDVLDPQGNKIGKLQNIYYDIDSGEPEWIGVESGMINKNRHLVPIDGATYEEEHIIVAYPKDRIDETPDIDDEQISPETESELYRIYGLQQPSFQSSQSDQASMGRAAGTSQDNEVLEGRETSQGYAGMRSSQGTEHREPSAGEGMTLHEEQVEIGKQRVPAGTARLQKWVETDTVQQDVALERERARVRHEPMNRAAPDASLREETVEVDLEREEPVVSKQTYATERVGLDKESEIEHQQVSADVSRERADIDTGTGSGRRSRSNRASGMSQAQAGMSSTPAGIEGSRQSDFEGFDPELDDDESALNRGKSRSERTHTDASDIPPTDSDPHEHGDHRAGFQ